MDKRFGEYVKQKTLRGTQVLLHASKFWEDPSVGIEWQPEELWAVTDDGQQEEFELTAEEEDDWFVEASQDTRFAKELIN